MSDAAELRAWGNAVGRAGMSQQVIDEIANFDGSYKEAMRLAGRIHQIAIAARSDDYWNEQVEHGKLDFVRRCRKNAPVAHTMHSSMCSTEGEVA